MQSDSIQYEVDEGVAYITLDRPPLNLIDLELTEDYLRALDTADADEDVKVLVLSGNGKGLSAGVDICLLYTSDAADE